MRKFLGCVTAITILATGMVAQAAQQSGATTGGTTATSTRTEPGRQSFTFTDELVQAQLIRPDVTRVRGNPRGHGITLLRLREHFVPEMLKSIERL